MGRVAEVFRCRKISRRLGSQSSISPFHIIHRHKRQHAGCSLQHRSSRDLKSWSSENAPIGKSGKAECTVSSSGWFALSMRRSEWSLSPTKGLADCLSKRSGNRSVIANSPRPTSVIHRSSGQIIYLATTSTYTGHVVASISPSPSPSPSPSSRPRPLALPPIFGPGREISISPSEDWIVVFHPTLSSPSQIAEGGTLAIYPSSVISPLALPNTTVPFATFPLASDPLSIIHLYHPPNSTSTALGRGSHAGPRAPASYSSTQGPALVVLTSTGLILFHPQAIPSPLQGPANIANNTNTVQYGTTVLRCPLHTRWYAASGGAVPPEIGRADRGWGGVVQGDTGVWFAYEDRGVLGVIRAEVIVKDGKVGELCTVRRVMSGLSLQC